MQDDPCMEAGLTDSEGSSLDQGLAAGQALSRRYSDALGVLRRRPGTGLVGRATSAWLQRSAAGGAGPEQVSPALVERAKNGDAAAREELLIHMLPLVIRLARSYKTSGLELEDFVQEGMVGVLRALSRFDPGLGTPFPAYASWWIRYSLQDLRSQFIRPLSLPPKALRRMAALKEAHEQMYLREQRDATPEELALAVGLPTEEIHNLLRADARVRGLDEPLGDDSEVSTLGELLADPLSEEAFEEVLSSIQAEELRALVTHLSEREREILVSRYGLDGREEETLREVGERLGVSPERVRQLENRALAKLRHQV